MAYHPSIRTRCVTLDGNDYSPSGLLTSGHRSIGGALLPSLHELVQAKDAMQKSKSEYDGIQEQLSIQSKLKNKHEE